MKSEYRPNKLWQSTRIPLFIKNQMNPLQQERNNAIDPTYFCNKPGCDAGFDTYEALEQHLTYGTHMDKPIKLSMKDKALHLFLSKVTDIRHQQTNYVCTSIEKVIKTAYATKGPSEYPQPMQGSALADQTISKPFNKKQRDFLNKEFDDGFTKKKVTPLEVKAKMEAERNEDGTKKFTIEELLTVQQIQNYFARRRSKLEKFDEKRITIQTEPECEETITSTYDQSRNNIPVL